MAKIHQLKITLKNIKPPIWRRIEVPSDMKLSTLAEILLFAMGWAGYHLMSFEVNDETYYPDKESVDELGGRLMTKVKLDACMTAPKQKALFTYDFGDNWEHDVVLEAILDPEPGAVYPRCTAGARNCPPEDCGGVWGYEELLATIKNPKHPEYKSMMAWLGGAFDPEA